jgi:hypothetical protein
MFAKTKFWNTYDPFFASKEETYKSSSRAMIREPFNNGSLTCVLMTGWIRDLAKSLMALDERKDLLDGWDTKDSALEIIFLYVPAPPYSCTR